MTDPSGPYFFITLGVFVSLLALVLLGTGPFPDLVRAFGLPVTLHAGAATGLLLTGAMSLPLSWQLLKGIPEALGPLRLLATVEALLALLAAGFGNWLFIRLSYGGILHFAPPVHQTLFEFKRLIALFPLPLATAAAFILWYNGSHVVADPPRRTLVVLLLALGFFYLFLAFGLGAVSTRLRTL
jgi:hypothetical protein